MSERQLFFAARRCYYTNGKTYLIGINLKTSTTHSITERKLIDRGISLGDFFHATLVSDQKLEELRKAVDLYNRPEIEIEGHFAKITNLPAKLINDYGTLLFKTEMFGLIRSPGQSIELGDYKISVRISTSTENILPNMTYAVISYQLISPPLPSPLSPAPEDPFVPSESFSSLLLEPLPDVSELVAHFAARKNRIMSPVPMDFPDLPRVPVDLPKKTEDSDDIQKKKSVVVGEGFNITVPQNPSKEMKAFVMNFDDGPFRRHWLWICDIGEPSLFQSSDHELEQGHFFEGRFVLNNGLWKCIKYLQPITPLFQGSIVRGYVHLEATVANYQEPVGKDEYGMVTVENIGLVVDTYHKLDKLRSSSIGKKIRITRGKVGKERYWVVSSVML